jgi:hypothetical protein
MQLSKNSKTVQVITPTAGAAGTADINGTTIDMQGFSSVLFLVMLGAITASAVTSIKVQQSDASDMSGAEDLEGSAQTIAVADAEKIFGVDIHKPTKRYVRLVVDRGTANAVVSSAVAIQYNAWSSGSAQGTNVAIETFASPAAGTA